MLIIKQGVNNVLYYCQEHPTQALSCFTDNLCWATPRSAKSMFGLTSAEAASQYMLYGKCRTRIDNEAPFSVAFVVAPQSCPWFCCHCPFCVLTGKDGTYVGGCNHYSHNKNSLICIFKQIQS